MPESILTNFQYSRIQQRGTNTPGVIPTIFAGSTSAYTEYDQMVMGNFLDTDILENEIFFNAADKRMFIRLENEIHELNVLTGATYTDTYTTGATLSGSIATYTLNDGNTYQLQLSGLTGNDVVFVPTYSYLPLTGNIETVYVVYDIRKQYLWNDATLVYDELSTGSSTLTGLTDVNISSLTDGQILTYDLATDKWINGDITRTEGDDHYVLWRDQQTNTNKTTYLQYSEANGRMMLNPGTGGAMNAAYSLGIQDKITNTQAIDDGQINLEGLNLYIKGASVGATGGQIFGMKVEALPEKDGDTSVGVYIQSGWGLHGDQYPMRIETPSMGTGKVLMCLDGVTGYAEWSDLPTPTGGTGTNTIFTTGSTGLYSIKAINDTTTDATGDYAFAAGQDNFVSSPKGFSFGNNNIVGGINSAGAIGQANEIYSRWGFVGGRNNIVYSTAEQSLTFGDGHLNSAAYSFIIGDTHIANSAATRSAIIGGLGNTINNENCVILGGQSIATTTNDTVYVPNLNINYTPNTTSTTDNKLLCREADGSVSISNLITKFERPLESASFLMAYRINSKTEWDEIDFKAINESTLTGTTSGKIMMNWNANGTAFQYTIVGAADYGDVSLFNIYPVHGGSPWTYNLQVDITGNAWSTYATITKK